MTSHIEYFNTRNKVLTAKLLRQGYRHHKLHEPHKGPYRWKPNTSILNATLYRNNIRELIKKVKSDNDFLSKQLLWEMCKIKIKEHTIGYCTRKQSVKKNVIKEVEKHIEEKEEELINSNYKHSIQMEKDALANNLHKLIEEQKLGAHIRSRAKWVEEEEKSSNIFII